MELILNISPYGEFRRSSEGPVSQIHSPHLHVGVLGIFFRSFKVFSDARERERERGAESNWKLQDLSIPSKAAAWVPEFAVEDLPLSRTAALVP